MPGTFGQIGEVEGSLEKVAEDCDTLDMHDYLMVGFLGVVDDQKMAGHTEPFRHTSP